jgi:hypothetical protein
MFEVVNLDDMASHAEDCIRTDQIYKSVVYSDLLPTGRCYNCKTIYDDIEDMHKLFCDLECSQEYDYVQKRIIQNKKDRNK